MSSRSINLQNSPEVQKVYVNWCNSYLRSLNLKVSNLDKDFQNGVLLIKLVEIISGQKCKLKYRQHPKNQIELIDNCSVALRYVSSVSSLDSRFATIDSEDLSKGDLKQIIGLIWKLIYKFQIPSEIFNLPIIKKKQNSPKISFSSAKEKILNWVKNRLKPFKIEVNNFSKSFSNGDAYFALVESEFPDQKETFQIKFKNPVEKLKKSFNFANKLMDIPELLDPEDVFKEKMDEFSHFLYTSYFFKFHFQNNKKRIPKENYKNILLDSSSKNSKTEIDSPQKSKFSSPIKEIKSIEQISKIISSPNEMQKEINGMKFIKIESTKNSIFLEWKSRKKEPFYEILVKDISHNLKKIFPEIPGNNILIRNLDPETLYQVYLRPQKEENQKKWVIQKEIITKSFVPKKITFISSTPSFDSCLLQWEIPKHYKIPIEHYEIEIISDEKKKKNKNSKLQKTFVNEIVINKLKPNYLYHFRIRTFNKKGYSEWSDFNSFKTISSFTPSTIQDGIKIIQNDPNHLAIKWNEPENNGHVIDYYQLELNGQIIEHVQNSFIDLKQFYKGKRYRMRIRSHNNNGFSVWSSPQVFTTICDIPNQVSYHWIYCIPDSNKIELNWLKPEENGKPIEYYEIEVYKSSHEVYKTEKTKLETHIITDLQPRTQYRLRIRSFSEIGYSDWSEFLEVTTSRIILPEKIQDIRCVRIQPRELVFEWSEAKTRGLAIDYYEIEMGNENNNQLQNVQDLTYTFSNLNPGNRYVFRVRAHNKQGFGEWSKSLNVSTNTSEPDPIPNLSPRHVAANQIEMTWEKPEDNGSNITLYELEISSPLQKDPEIQKTTRKRFRIPNLRPNTFYDIRVRAQSDHGPSEWSEVVTVKTKKSKPEKIERVWITNRSLTQAELVWEPPKDNGDSIDFYQIEMNDSKTFAPVSSLTSSRTRAARRRALALDPDLPEFHQLFGDMSPKQRLSKMLMRLQSDTEYKIRIRAHNKHGFSEWSGYSQFTLTLLETLKVDEIFCQSHSTRIDLNWNIPQYRRDEIEFYEIEYFSFSLLQNHNILQADERNDSPIPTISSLHIQDEQVDLDEDLTDTPAYRSCVNENVIQLNRSYENHKTLDGLDPEQVYEIRIRAYDPSLGFGSWSSFHAFETLAQEPDPRPDAVQLIFPGKESENRSSKTRPFSPAFDSITNRSIAGVPNAIDEVHGFFDQVTEPKNLILSWKEPANNGGPVDKYIVEISGKIVLETFDTHINIVRLKASINHTFRIRAHNRFGFGQWSSVFFLSDLIQNSKMDQEKVCFKEIPFVESEIQKLSQTFDLPTAIKFSKYDPNDDLYICYIGNKEIKIKLLSNSNKSKEKKGEQFNLFVLENGNFIHFFNYVLDIFEEEKTVLQSPKKESFSEINPRRNSSQHRTKSNNQQQDSRKQNPLKLRSSKHVPKITRPKNKNHQEEMKAKKTKKDGRKKKHKPQKKMEKFSRNLVDNQPQIEKSEEVKKEKRQKSTTYQNPSPLPNKVKFQSLPKLPTLENARIDFNQHHSKKDN